LTDTFGRYVKASVDRGIPLPRDIVMLVERRPTIDDIHLDIRLREGPVSYKAPPVSCMVPPVRLPASPASRSQGSPNPAVAAPAAASLAASVAAQPTPEQVNAAFVEAQWGPPPTPINVAPLGAAPQWILPPLRPGPPLGPVPEVTIAPPPPPPPYKTAPPGKAITWADRQTGQGGSSSEQV